MNVRVIIQIAHVRRNMNRSNDKMKKTHTNGELRLTNVGNDVTLVGWVSKRRNFGALVFIDLRDREGITQLVFNETIAKQIVEVRNEYIIQVSGCVVERKDKNPNLVTGDIEIKVECIEILNTAETTPLIVADETDALEDTRLKYRYLDLRRKELQNNLALRHRVTMLVRTYLSNLGFLEIETPILCKSTPEGARDYLVPSRIHEGEFYALPQSPQLYKQLLMVGGMEKYFQIARCFRDEDLRSDRQPEFSQIDIEMSFIEEEDIWQITEGLMSLIFKEIKGIHSLAFPKISYDECMERYGSDKPDIRFDLELQDFSTIFEHTQFQVFQKVIASGGRIQGIVLKNSADKISRKDFDKLQEYARLHGANALSYVKYNNGEVSGSIVKVISDSEKDMLLAQGNMEHNDILFLVADKTRIAQGALGALRLKLAKTFHLIDTNKQAFVWVTNFPMFAFIEEEERYVAAHHPFTSPNLGDVDKLLSDPANCYSRAYDLVLNGYELLSGSIRIHNQDVQRKVFEAIGMSMQEANDKFGWFINAFKYGTPPHGGVGIGLERLIMILAGTDNIRDVVAFPKTASASDMMSEAPSPVYKEQLEELHISFTK